MFDQVFAGTSIREAGTCTRVFCDCVYLPTTTNDCVCMSFFLLFKWIRIYYFKLTTTLVKAFDWVLEVKGFSGILLDVAYEVVAVYKVYVCRKQATCDLAYGFH